MLTETRSIQSFPETDRDIGNSHVFMNELCPTKHLLYALAIQPHPPARQRTRAASCAAD